MERLGLANVDPVDAVVALLQGVQDVDVLVEAAQILDLNIDGVARVRRNLLRVLIARLNSEEFENLGVESTRQANEVHDLLNAHFLDRAQLPLLQMAPLPVVGDDGALDVDDGVAGVDVGGAAAAGGNLEGADPAILADVLQHMDPFQQPPGPEVPQQPQPQPQPQIQPQPQVPQPQIQPQPQEPQPQIQPQPQLQPAPPQLQLPPQQPHQPPPAPPQLQLPPQQPPHQALQPPYLQPSQHVLPSVSQPWPYPYPYSYPWVYTPPQSQPHLPPPLVPQPAAVPSQSYAHLHGYQHPQHILPGAPVPVRVPDQQNMQLHTPEAAGAGAADTLPQPFPPSPFSPQYTPRNRPPTQHPSTGQSASSLGGRWKELKLSGQIGSPGQKDKLTHSALSFQIASAEQRGYAEPEIVAAVIRAITPGEDLRTYLEMTPNLTLTVLRSILRAHFKEKDATSVFTELSNGTQLATESENDFCWRMMGLRQKVLMLSAEESGQYTMPLVQSQFQKSLSTGFRRESVRQQLRGILKQETLSDVQLMKEISDVVMIEAEHDQKSSKSKQSVNAVSTTPAVSKSTPKNTNPIVAEITKLTAQVSQLTGLQSGIQADLDNLRQNLQWTQPPGAASPAPSYIRPAVPNGPSSYGASRGRGARTWGVGRGSTAGRPFSGRGSMACPPCHQNDNPFCRHCFYCGDDISNHRVASCPKRLEDEQKNADGGQS